jgi:hypothetical protein
MARLVSTGRTISTSEYLEKKQKARRKRLLVVCGALLGFLVLAVLTLRLQTFQITEVVAEGVPATGAAEVEDAARAFLAGSYLWLVPKTNALIYPKARLEAALEREYPRLSSVSASLEGAHELRIAGVERKPYALYCVLALSGVEGCYFLDETGFIFDASPTFSDGVYFTYTADPALTDPLGKQFLTPNEFEALAGFVTQVATLGVEPRSLALTEDQGTLLLANGASIIFSRSADIPALADTLKAFLASDEIKAQADFWQKLATLDIRVPNKVFYVFK